MTGRLAGKVALITGGARGIGRTMSEVFVREGAAVVMAGRNADAGRVAEAELRAAGGRATFVRTDIGDAAQVRRAVEVAVSDHGSLTTLVNNAASVGIEGPLADVDQASWDEVLRVDLGGVVHACREAIPHLIEAGGGSIIALGSTTATYGQRGIPARIAAKSAVAGLMRAIAVDYGPQRIRANTVVPGLVPHDEFAFVGAGELGEAMLAANALPFFGEPRDIADAALYLASDEARWVTGTELVVSGGITRAPDVLDLVSRQLAALGERP